jgi:hypothetical protein
VQDKFAPAGYIPIALGPDEVAVKVRADREKWTRLVQEVGVKPE